MTGTLSRRAVLTGLSASTLLLASGCGRSGSSRGAIRIGTTEGLNLTMTQLLRQEGFFKSFDVDTDVLTLADGSKALGGIFGGSMDLVPMSGIGQLFPAMERGADLKIINAATLIPLLALFSSKPNVRTLKDLEGKVMGVGSVGSLDYLLTVTLLRKYSVDVSTVRFVNIGSNIDTFKAVRAGTIDAGVGPASYVDDADWYKVHALANGDMSVELQDFTYQAGWTSGNVIRSKRDALVRVLAAYAKLFRYVQQPSAKDGFLSASRTVFPSTPEREHVDEWNFLQKVKPFALDLKLSPERVQYVQKINVDFGIQKEALPYDRVVDMSLVQDALKLAG
jgi:ABC-type nitrate/sulfonate/bicarbonate transport system substrate-binding protein